MLFRLGVSAASGFVAALLALYFWPESPVALAVLPMLVALVAVFVLLRRMRLEDEGSLGAYGFYEIPNQWHSALSAAGVGAWVWDLDSNEMHCTEDVFNILGRPESKEESSMSLFEDAMHIDDRPVFRLALESVKGGTRRSPIDCRFVKPSGGVVWVELTMCLTEENGRKKRIAGAMTDITERKEVEAQLDRGAAYLEAILENTDNIVFSIDRQFRLTVFNSRFLANVRASYGLRLQLGDNILDASPEDVLAVWMPRYERALAGASFRVEEVFKIKGKRFYFDVSLKPIREQGRVIGAAVYSRNITKQKLREKEWLKAKEKAEESDQLKSAFLANMSHEIRTPLNAVMGFTQLLKSGDGTEEERDRFIDIILSNGNHLLRILGDIIDLAQIESNQLSVEPVHFDLRLLMAETYAVFHDRIRAEADGLLELEIDTNTASADYVFCDETRLKQILYNLISNAIKFTLQGSIHVGYERKPYGMVEFYVADTGSGVPLEMRERIFKRFRQGADHLGRRNDGVGLGLSICEGLVALLGGEVWIEDNTPHGSVFRFTVKDHSAAGERPETGAGAASKHDSQDRLDGRFAGSKVLVAEDDDMNFQVVEQFLLHEKLKAIRAENGEEAIRLVESDSEIRLVVMDLSMPILNGWEATKRIKQLRPELPVIAQTAHAMKNDLDLALDAGCSDCLVKPISITSFKAVISRYV